MLRSQRVFANLPCLLIQGDRPGMLLLVPVQLGKAGQGPGIAHVQASWICTKVLLKTTDSLPLSNGPADKLGDGAEVSRQ